MHTEEEGEEEEEEEGEEEEEEEGEALAHMHTEEETQGQVAVVFRGAGDGGEATRTRHYHGRRRRHCLPGDQPSQDQLQGSRPLTTDLQIAWRAPCLGASRFCVLASQIGQGQTGCGNGRRGLRKWVLITTPRPKAVRESTNGDLRASSSWPAVLLRLWKQSKGVGAGSQVVQAARGGRQP